MNRISDLTLFIVRVGKLDRRQLPELERLYQEHRLNNLAVVLNGAKKGSRGYGMVTDMATVLMWKRADGGAG